MTYVRPHKKTRTFPLYSESAVIGRVIHTLDRLVVDAECAMNLQGLAVVVRSHHLTLLVAVRYRAGYPLPLIQAALPVFTYKSPLTALESE